MFTREDFRVQLEELADLEVRMLYEYRDLVDRLDDEELRLTFTRLLQDESKHARQLKMLRRMVEGGSEIATPPLRWSIGRKVGLLNCFLLIVIAVALVYSRSTLSKVRADLAEVTTILSPLQHEMIVIQHEHANRVVAIERALRELPDADISPQTVTSLDRNIGRSDTLVAEAVAEGLRILNVAESPTAAVQRRYGQLGRALERLKQMDGEFAQSAATLRKHMTTGRQGIQRDVVTEFVGGASDFGQQAAEVLQNVESLQRQIAAQAAARESRFEDLYMVFLIAGLLIGGGLSILVISRIGHNLAVVASDAQTVIRNFVADETPRVAMAVESSDEVGILAHLMRTLIGEYASNLHRRHKLEAELGAIAVTDQLTGASNRRRCDELLERELGRSKRYKTPMVVLFLDLDHFKAVNDKHGHAVGDTVLIELVRVLEHLLRATDYLFRYGGEEFLVIGSNTELANGKILAEKVRTAVKEHDFSPVEGITVSVGLTAYVDGDSVQDLVKRADEALYEAKNAGRDQVCIKG